MTTLKLHHGDCLNVLDLMEENSVDAVVTDPPYHLTSGGKGGFMGKAWDGGDIAFNPDTWRKVMRVLKPGGHIVAFGAPKNYHRLACAIEDAGFEVRDSLMWVFGCLDEKSMAVTPYGIVPHHILKTGDLVLSYDVENGTYQWDEIEEVFRYEISDTVFRISTDYGDQIVSRNHRCIIERGGKEGFSFAEDSALEREARLPILEDLPALLAALPHSHTRAGNSKYDMQHGVSGRRDWEEKHGCKTSRKTQRKIEGYLRSLRNCVLEKHKVAGQSRKASLLTKMQRCVAWRGMEETRAQRSCGVVGRIGSSIKSAAYGAVKPFLEGWRNISAQAGKLCLSSLRSLSEFFFANGEDRRVCDGTPFNCCANDWAVPNENRGGSSHRPRSAEQRNKQLDVVQNEQGPQVVRAWGGHKTVVGRFNAEHYSGIIWCVKVRTGAFVAVRNGLAFPTGNSGFPKSLDVSKAIDKAAGAEREVIGKEENWGASKASDGKKAYGDYAGGWDITAPATDAAREWSGWGTALKPAYEPIVLARKPLSEGTVAANVLKWGCGALNIDATRVSTEGETIKAVTGKATLCGTREGYDRPWKHDPDALAARQERANEAIEKANTLGRWPANLCHDGSQEVVDLFPSPHGAGSARKAKRECDAKGMFSFAGDGQRYGDEGSAARFFKSCSYEEDEKQLQNSRMYYCAKANKHDRAGSKHPTVKPVALMQWLIRMVTPPGGTVLDPFAGSGTTGQAAINEGFNPLLIEREVEYVQDIKNRFEGQCEVVVEKSE